MGNQTVMNNTTFKFSQDKKNLARRKDERSKTRFSKIIKSAYRHRTFRSLCLILCNRLENGRLFSQTLREILDEYHGVSVGRYSYGPCLDVGFLPQGTSVGSYCSFGSDLVVFRRNHPVETLTQHPFFYNQWLGIVDNDTIITDSDNPLSIGSDVWIGSRTTILPGCRRIGNGVIIGSNSVVTKDVDDFSIIGGNPAKVIKKRFSSDIGDLVNATSWWNLELSQLMDANELLICPVTKEKLHTFANSIVDRM